MPIASKELTIHTYELGFSRRALEHGLQIGAVHPEAWLLETTLRASAATPSVLRRIAEGTPVSPTLHLWRPLLDDGFPFVKRQLIRDGIANLDDLRPYVPARTLALAEADVRRRGGARRQSNRQRTSVRSTRRPSSAVSFLPSSRERALYVIGTS